VPVIVITPANSTIKRGEGQTFTARVDGANNPRQEVTWKLDGVGSNPSATAITTNGMVLISGGTVSATSADSLAVNNNSTGTVTIGPGAKITGNKNGF